MALVDHTSMSGAMSQEVGPFMTTSACMNGLTTFAAAWPISLATMALATLDATSQTLVSSVV